MKRYTAWAMVGCVVGSAASVACGGGGTEQGAYFAADGQARRAGHGLMIGDSVESGVLPVAIDPALPAELVGPSLEQPLELEPGTVVIVRGGNGKIAKLTLGADVDPDALLVRGTEEAVLDLARALGGDAEQSGSGYIVRAPDALHAVTIARAPDGVSEVMPLETSFLGLAPDGPPLELGAQPAESAIGNRALPGALGGGELPVCEGVAGTWQGRLRWDHSRFWYDFTLEVEQSGRDRTALSGSIRAQAWRGGVLDADPPATCQSGPDADHFVVEMPAGGLLRETGISFEGLSWRTAEQLCGHAPAASGDYCEDRFSGTLSDDGHLLRARNDDGCNPIESVVFVRTACSPQARF